MEFKGTKGRWSIDYSYDEKHDQACINIDSGVSIKSLATVWSGSDENCIQTIADAKLIAKAPEMLKLLNEITDFFSDNISEFGEMRDYADMFIIKGHNLINEATNI